ncbi:mechanosensitive ion channel family protein [Imtechella halotolerans]|uniref:Mechanosensitive ion channel protein MscS n=1 Tax=Imtechella halotolerans K1 TaxID=946077 RepID=I0WGL4_9FLAO|nr:mechanosensitive ion channel domain-containing protein [Imtechella halotolerans]EID75530.1 mechanosensitive ion channel protein MscS [Imtechella halotolerans K1]WMQ63641.1 mechanosensitive ion channel [Imtechella halotolerans]
MNELIELFRKIFLFKIVNTEKVTISVLTVVTVILAFILTNILLRFVRKTISKRLPVQDRNKFVSIFQVLKYGVYIIVVIFTLNASGVNMNVFLTASAALFVGLGFALQQLFQDIISGILLILDQSMHVGDIVEVNGIVGRVEEIRLRSTRVINRDGRVLVVPNHKFMNDTLYNYTQNGNILRENVSVGVAYGTDVELVKQILLEVADSHTLVLKDPKPMVIFSNFGESSLDFELYFFVSDGFITPRIKSDLRFRINQQFNARNISVPFPQRDVHIITKT